jgi:membrane fusion protein (multidrug efflux system)
VFVIEADAQGKERARVREVKVAAMAGDEVVISKGLNAGERVAASGSFKLRDAVLVAVTAPTDAVASTAAVADGG